MSPAPSSKWPASAIRSSSCRTRFGVNDDGSSTPSAFATRRTSSHYTEDEWRGYFAAAGLEVEAAESFVEYLDFESLAARTGCEGETAREVRELLAEETVGDGWNYPYLVFRARKSA